jgi:RNA polymerase sigma-70 factor (ECF subfamily)
VEGRPTEDAVLTDRARDGDVDAYEELVRRYRELAFRVAWLVARDRNEAEDAMQEAFVKAYHAMGRFRPGAPFKPWLMQIVANEARNRVRASRRREALRIKVGSVAASGDAAPSPEAAALAHDDAQALLRALDELRDEDRLVVSYRYLFELSEAETADALGLPAGTVKSRLSRALVKLRTHLAGSEGVNV